MTHPGKTFSYCLALALCAASAYGQAKQPAKSQPEPAKDQDRATAYYNFAMGHLYSELAGTFGNRGDYFDKAIEHYKAALAADPGAAFLSEELTDLYVQSNRLKDALMEAEEMLRRDPQSVDAHRMLGRIYSRLIGDPRQNKLNEDNLRKAVEQFAKVTEREPKDVDSWLMLGRLYNLQQNSVDSEKAYKKVLDIEPENEYALAGLAQVYNNIGDGKSAIEMWQRLAKQNPNPRTLRALATAHEQIRDYPGAAQALKQALELAPNDVEIKRDLAEDLLMAENFAEALSIYGELAAADPKDPHLFLRMSQIYRHRRDFAKARENHNKALAIDPNNIEIRFNEVNLLEAEGKYPAAIAKMKEVLESTTKKSYTQAEKSNRMLLLQTLAFLYRSNEQPAQAVEVFQQMAQLDPDQGARTSAQIIETYRGAKDFVKAEQAAEVAVKKYPADRTVRLFRASVLSDQGRVDEAAADVKKLFDGKNDRETHLALAQIYDKGKRFDEIAKSLDEAEKLSDTPEEKETIAFMRGAMYEKMRKYDEAEAEFRKVIQNNPKNASALNYLGYMLADRGVRLPEALELISKALELDPNNGAFLDSLGWTYFKMGKYEQAETNLRLSLEKVSNDPTVHDHLGDAYFQQGKIKEAIGQWEASLRQWDASAKAEQDATEVAKVHKKLESARVRLAKESSTRTR